MSRKSNRKSGTSSTSKRRSGTVPTSKPSDTVQTRDTAGGVSGPRETSRRKLSQEEIQRRRKNGLCFYCGKRGHLVKECRKKKAGRRTKSSTPASADGTWSKQRAIAGTKGKGKGKDCKQEDVPVKVPATPFQRPAKNLDGIGKLPVELLIKVCRASRCTLGSELGRHSSR